MKLFTTLNFYVRNGTQTKAPRTNYTLNTAPQTTHLAINVGHETDGNINLHY